MSSSITPSEIESIKSTSALHQLPSKKVSYGTAGFRTKATDLDSTLFRVGLLAALRSKFCKGKTVGVMITASHNPEEDNGVKLVEPMGEMLPTSWEGSATALANSPTEDDLIKSLDSIISEFKIDMSFKPSIIYAHDTRPSCPDLVKSLEDGMKCFGSETIPAGLKTTPQLHYLVRCLNTKGLPNSYGEPTEEGYYKKLSAAFLELTKGKQSPSPLTVDCANGVGAVALKAFIPHLGSSLSINIANDKISIPGALNNSCGADYVKTKQRAPEGIVLVPGERYCSYDGDADRIIYYYADENGTFRLLDGDKIAGLCAMFIIDQVKLAGLDLDVGVVQTAYANGSSTDYLTEVLNVPVRCVPTGVKHLHHAAEQFDVGVYFEANGHGTVLFSSGAIGKIFEKSPSSPAQQESLRLLRALTKVINQTVGDAISDMLLIEAILIHKKWKPFDWDSGYQDLPNRLVKVIVKDRTIFTTTDAERRLVKPQGMQDTITLLAKKYQKGRSFVRPSGTEDCVRVYAEALKREEADSLAYTVSGVIFDQFGKGEKPLEFK